MKKLTAILLMLTMAITVGACGKKEKDTNSLDKEKIGYLFGDKDAENLSEEDEEMLDVFTELATISVMAIFHYPDNMNPAENLKVIEDISSSKTLETNKEIINTFSKRFQVLKVESLSIYDIEVYDEEGKEGLFSVIAGITLNENGKQIKEDFYRVAFEVEGDAFKLIGILGINTEDTK